MALRNRQVGVISCGIAVQAFIFIVLNAFVVLALTTVLAKEAGSVDMVWIAFQAWAMYFLAGCTVMGGIRAFIGYATGVIASICIIALMGVFAVIGNGFLFNVGMGINLAMALAVFIVVIPAIFLSEKLKNFIPALFVGSGAFFALSTVWGLGANYDLHDFTMHWAASLTVLAYCLFGLLNGYITVFWRSRYEASLNKDKPQESSPL